jgi:glycosyltransferase involved in cell wall biosynthesis
MLKGNLDQVSRREIVGWAHDDAHPDQPVSLLILDNDSLIGRVLANRYRADLEQAGIGGGRHAFEFDIPGGLAPFEPHVIRVCRETDGADLAQSPVVIEPSQSFDHAAREALARLIARYGMDQDIVNKVDFLADQIDRLLQQLADRDSMRIERRRYRHLVQRWSRRLPHDADGAKPGAAPAPVLRALVIDDRAPKADRDAGSNAILSHMRSLQRLGYEVTFVPALELGTPGLDIAALDGIGVRSCRAPYYGSVEEVLRRQAGEFDVIYLHRVSNAAKYGELARSYCPRARRVYSVADLHHVRLARQANVEDRPEVAALARRVRLAELTATAMSDAVITHSKEEAELLRKEVRGANIHVALWSAATRPTPVPFAGRRGLAFIGGFAHEPNRDAAQWLIGEIMPLLRRGDPGIECLLVGSDMPEHLLRACGNGVVPVGYVKDLAEIFDRVRLTVAPLDYGAGVKGKVIESLAAGVPCICTPIAAEGLDLPPALRACVVQGTEAIAGMALRLHSDEAANDECRCAGLEFVEATLSEAELDATMRRVLGLPAAPATLPSEPPARPPAPEPPPSEPPAAEPPGLRLKVTRKKPVAVSPSSEHPRDETPPNQPPAGEPVKASRVSKRSKGRATAPSSPPSRKRGGKPGKSGVKPAKKR